MPDYSKVPLLKKLDNYGLNGKKKGVRGVEVAERLRGYKNLLELIPNTKTACIAEPLSTERIPLTHNKLRSFISKEFDLCKFGLPEGCRIALLLPNGPELAVAVIATVSRWCAAPINPTNTKEEIKAELESTKSQAIIILAGASANEAALEAARALDIGVIVASPAGSISGLFHLALLHKVPESAASCGYSVARTVDGFQAFDHPETVLLLHTSGTSGNKKLVPYSLDMIVTGVGCIVASWDLRPSDVCLNMMPLFHIGGIMRNILSPILSGGCVITCSGFDPLLFWDVLSAPLLMPEDYPHSPELNASYQSGGAAYTPLRNDDDSSGLGSGSYILPTWYYAAPTMHHAILMEAERRPKPLPVDSVRYIANAAGGLLPVLADALKTTFKNAVILTSYGMTECMPISTPPQNYALDPIGTSGIQVGPDIVITDDDMKPVPNGVKGNIMVRGPPCFGGYENNFAANDESFFEINGLKGWFNTGDMGSLDDEGYLFISGRSKEIINRGGETISPFEIEEAIQQHPSVKETLAFSAPHEQYQETVGCVIVTRPGFQRVDLPTLHQFLEDKLHRSKWPYVIVYSDGLPKNAANKILRIRYAERSKMAPVDEETSPLTRLFESKCPPVGTPLTSPITLTPVTVTNAAAEDLMKKQPGVAAVAVIKVDLPFKPDCFVAFVTSSGASSAAEDEMAKTLHALCVKHLHCYQVPVFVHPVGGIPYLPVLGGEKPPVDEQKLRALAQQVYADLTVVKPRNAVESQIEAIWRDQLGVSATVSVTASFFDLGGDSLKAGQLINAMRKKLRVQLSVADLFTAPTIETMAHKVSVLQTLGSPNPGSGPSASGGKGRFDKKVYTGPVDFDSYEYTSQFASDSWGCLFVQALPITFLFPVRRVAVWFIIASIWVEMMKEGWGRFYALVIAMVLSRLLMGICAPLVGIAAKWLIIGRYKSGRYPLWGNMYLRWWIVEQIVNIAGKGIFKDDIPIIGTQLVRLYYVMMGATIGSNVKIHKDAKLGQADLLTIGDDVAIDVATIRPFAVEEGHFILLPITIGSRSSVGLKSIVAPGANLPPGTCLGPLSSSYEADDSEAYYRNYCRPTFQSPPTALIIFCGIPILAIQIFVKLIPWYFGLQLMVESAKSDGWYESDIHSVFHAFLWWITPQRLVYYFLLRVIRRCLVPFMQLFVVIIIKRVLIGKFTPMNAEEKAKPWNRFRYWLMSKLLPGGAFIGVSRLVGTHYEIISVIFRLLGSKVGKRVYWPGSGLDIVEYDLLEVGDDVVFGSRSVILTSSATRSAPVVFEAGSMVADRCVILPGVKLRRAAVLGSGSLAAEDMDIPVGSVWVGSVEGSAVNVAPADVSFNVKNTLTPFGRAFYEGEASFSVIPLWGVALYNTAWQGFCTIYRNSLTPLALIVAGIVMNFEEFEYSPGELFRIFLASFCPLHVLFCLFAILIAIVAKWTVMGRRKQGAYPWDQSSYCQRWQIYLTLEEIRRGERRKTGVLDMIAGSQYLVWYFRALGCRIGRDVCLYPNGGDPMMTEPDLVTIGDGASIDDASLIAHINTRGIFRLNPLVVGNGAVLRSGTRLLSGASTDNRSCMLEHTLVLAGECVDSGSVWQGWPSRRQISLLEHRNNIHLMLDTENRRRRAEAAAAAANGDCCGCCPAHEDDKISLLESGSTGSLSTAKGIEMTDSDRRNAKHLDERRESFLEQERAQKSLAFATKVVHIQPGTKSPSGSVGETTGLLAQGKKPGYKT